jgi:hypothetical protein
MSGDGSGNIPDPGRPGPSRRSAHAQSSSSRHPGPQPFQPSVQHPYTGSPSTNPQENLHHVTAGSFQTPPQYISPSSPYSQHSGYVAQYTQSTQQRPFTMGHSTPPYQFPHSFHHPGVHAVTSSVMSQPMGAGYQPMIQPHSSAYQYQSHSHSDETGSSSMAAFSDPGTQNLTMYTHHQADLSSLPHSPLSQSPSGPSSTQSTAYPTPGYFQSSQYASVTQYPYFQNPIPISHSMYQSQYVQAPYVQSYVPSPEQEGQGSWWYLASSPPMQPVQYDMSSYAGHYPIGFSPATRPDVENPYGQIATASSSRSSAMYPMSMPHQETPFPGNQPEPPPPPPASSPLPTPPTQPPSPPNNPEPGGPLSGGATHASDRPIVRRHYHPNPPTNRSQWVMWAGNIPSDASHDELWRFFSQSSTPSAKSRVQEDAVSGGMVSIFLMPRSNCAFVNFETEAHLQAAILTFDGKPLRANDPRCPRIVCRIRRQDDDLKAGVGAQRGVGVHIRWIKDQQEKNKKARETSDSAPSASSGSPEQAPPVSSSEDDVSSQSNPRAQAQSSSSGSGSYASTNSSILKRHFPKRYFILKSLKQASITCYTACAVIHLRVMNSTIWILVSKMACGKLNGITRAFLIKHIGRAKTCI